MESLNVVNFACERIAELRAIEEHLAAVRPRFVSATNRLPVRLRRRAASYHVPKNSSIDTKKVSAVKKARSARRYRRRNRCLSARALRPDSQWLATHIWHAKRFHVITRWGFRLPLHPTDKVIHATVRAATNGCLLFDLSYYALLKLEGSASQIVDGLLHLIPPSKTGHSDLAASQSQSNRFWIRLSVHHRDQYPFGAIGPAELLWLEDGAFLWVHPGMRETIMTELSCVLSSDVTVTYLNRQFARFRLMGDRSHRLLHRLLLPHDDASNHADWSLWSGSLRSVWSTSYLPFRCALFLSVSSLREDNHRRLRPLDKDARWLKVEDDAAFARRHLNASSLKDCPHTFTVKWPNGQPGVPVLLLHQPGGSTGGSGWDLVLPWAEAGAFWRHLVSAGAEVGGLRELARCALELQLPRLPDEWADSELGAAAEAQAAAEAESKYKARPVNRRVHHRRLGIVAPFLPPWKRLCDEWMRPSVTDACPENCFVLRDQRMLRLLEKNLSRSAPAFTCANLLHHDKNLARALVPLRVQVLGRGIPRKQAVLCLPKECDQTDGSVLSEVPVSTEHEEEMGEEVSSLIHSTDRDIVGFIQRGEMSIKCGRAIGFGLCSFIGLVRNLVEPCSLPRKSLKLLMRNVNSTRYRLVACEVDMSL